MEVVVGFVQIPGVEDLIDDEEAHLVRQVEQLARRRVVRHPNGIHSELLQDFQLTFGRSVIERRSYRSKIVVFIDTLDSDALAVDLKTFASGEYEVTDAKSRFVFVDFLTVFGNQPRYSQIKMRLLGGRRTPDLRTVDLERVLYGLLSIRLDGDGLLGQCHYLVTRETSLEIQLEDSSGNFDL